jgi:hypothetical protein
LNKSFVLAGVCAAMIAGAGAAQAGTVETFDNPVTLSPTAAPGAWYTDRFNPAGFATSGGVLHETISGADHQAGDPDVAGGVYNFNNTQGRALDLGAGVTSLSIDLQVSADYAGSDQRLAGFWGVANDGTDISAFPIIELSDLDNTLVFRGFNTDTGAWTDFGAATVGTHTLGITLGASGFTYSIDGVTVGGAPGEGSSSIGSVILQGYNTGNSYDIAWDNLTTSAGVPEPASWALMIVGFGGIGAAMRRKRIALA